MATASSALYRRWARRLRSSMRQVHKGGEKVFRLRRTDRPHRRSPHIGEVRQAQVFVATLGATNYTYAEAHWGQDLPNWIGAHVRLFTFLGGVPEIVVPDNLKAGVKSPCRYEPNLNPSFQDVAQHYGIAVLPARSRKPKDKARVEVGVQVIEPWILALLRKRTFFGLAELNQAIRELLAELNARPMKHLGRPRCELFELLDRPALRPLPAEPYEFALWKKARVHIDYHVEFEHHYYSVPYALIHEEVDLRVTERTVEVFFRHRRVPVHPRVDRPGQHTTLAEHMPPAHRAYQEWSPERFTRWAQTIGDQTTQVVQTLLAARVHPQQAYRSCLGLLRLAQHYGAERLEAACARAGPAGICFYKGIKNILDARLDQAELAEPVTVVRAAHANVRGPGYYH